MHEILQISYKLWSTKCLTKLHDCCLKVFVRKLGNKRCQFPAQSSKRRAVGPGGRLLPFLIWEDVGWGKLCPHIIDSCTKNMTHVNWIFLLMKSFKKILYFFTCILPDYVAYDITKEFWKKATLKIWQLVFFWGVKTHFGKIPLKWCITVQSRFKKDFGSGQKVS